MPNANRNKKHDDNNNHNHNSTNTTPEAPAQATPAPAASQRTTSRNGQQSYLMVSVVESPTIKTNQPALSVDEQIVF